MAALTWEEVDPVMELRSESVWKVGPVSTCEGFIFYWVLLLHFAPWYHMVSSAIPFPHNVSLLPQLPPQLQNKQASWPQLRPLRPWAQRDSPALDCVLQRLWWEAYPTHHHICNYIASPRERAQRNHRTGKADLSEISNKHPETTMQIHFQITKASECFFP